MPFRLPPRTKLRVTSETIIGENHGSKKIQPAIALSLSCTVSNDWLDNLDPSLRPALYKKGSLQQAKQAASKNGQGELPVDDVVSETPIVRFPFLTQFPWDQEFSGNTLIVDRATGTLVVEDVTIDSLKITPKPNSVDLAFMAKSNKPDNKVRGELTGMIKTDIWAGVEPLTEAQASITDIGAARPRKAAAPAPALAPADEPLTPEKALAEADASARLEEGGAQDEGERPEGWPFPRDGQGEAADGVGPPINERQEGPRRRRRVVGGSPT